VVPGRFCNARAWCSACVEKTELKMTIFKKAETTAASKGEEGHKQQ
jgi:hypothetical protein